MNAMTHSRKMTMMTVLIGLAVLMAAAQLAHADSAQTMKFVQSFGQDSNNGYHHKIMVQSYTTGNQFFVWYYYSLGLEDGQDVVITFDDSKNWVKISNPKNGKDSDIYKVVKHV